jgi:cytidylate kinase
VFNPSGPLIITIDGPAGTGKSSVSRILAARLGVDFLDTGAMYRAATLLALESGFTPADVVNVIDLVGSADIHFDWTKDPPDIIAQGRILGQRIREKDVTDNVSAFSEIPELRAVMVSRQQEIQRAHPRLVTEGRDQGSAVFPKANVKIYLTASAKVRARRRCDQLRAQGHTPVEAQILQDIIDRDFRDMNRKVGPLIKPEDARVVDTSHLSREQVVDVLEHIVRSGDPN